MAKFSIGHEVEIKGFDKWTGVTLLGQIIGYVNRSFYTVEVFAVKDATNADDNSSTKEDESYHLQQQERYHVVHQHFVRDAPAEKEILQYNIGDIVDWEESCMILKGTIIEKYITQDAKNIEPYNMYTYSIRLDGSEEVVHGDAYDIRPHVPWN